MFPFFSSLAANSKEIVHLYRTPLTTNAFELKSNSLKAKMAKYAELTLTCRLSLQDSLTSVMLKLSLYAF